MGANLGEFALLLVVAVKSANSRSVAAWALAERQHGVIGRRQLIALGFTKSAIEHRIARGRLFVAARGVYLVGRPQMAPHSRWMAAVLACGEGAVLSHRSAAALLRIASPREQRIESAGPVNVSVPKRMHRRGSTSRAQRSVSIKVRSRPALDNDDCTQIDGIPVTTPIRTLLDLTDVLSPIALERAVNEADKQNLISPPDLRANLTRYRGLPGVRALRRLLDPETFHLSDSDLEILFRPIAARAGLPPPLGKQFVNDFEVDFFWPGLGLVVETDGLRYHRTPSAQARDRMRDQTHVASGLTTLRFTHWQVKHEPRYVEDVLRQTAGHLK